MRSVSSVFYGHELYRMLNKVSLKTLNHTFHKEGNHFEVFMHAYNENKLSAGVGGGYRKVGSYLDVKFKA